MSAASKIALASVLALMLALHGGVGTSPPARPSPSSAPVIVLHRTAAGAYFDPGNGGPMFVLVIGSDVRQGDPRGGRADSIHILAVDTKKGRGTIVGIPRDSYVPVPGAGVRKINSSLQIGGPERVVATVSQLAGIKFRYWALVEFSRFRALVDDLGGVTVNVPYDMKDFKYSGANFRPGRNFMKGKEALSFARNRHATPNGDFSRSENQGRLLLAGLGKFRIDAANPLKVAHYIAAFHSLVATNVAPSDLLRLAILGRKLDPKKFRNVVLPGSAGSAGGASVVFLSPGAEDIFTRIRTDAVL